MRVKIYLKQNLPVTIEIQKITAERVMKHVTTDLETVRNWCTHDKPCIKYNCRPCCPPRVKTFDKLKKRKSMYIIKVSIAYDDYMEYSPKTKESPRQTWLFMGATHKITRALQNKIVQALFEKGDQGFRVGGCVGCQYSKTGECLHFMPAPEATGINVVSLTKDVFGIDICWLKNKVPTDTMIAVGGLYTDRDISPRTIKEIILKITGGK